MAEPEIDIESIVEETIEFVTVRPDGDGWVGDAPDWFGERLFGGFVLSQSVHAVTRTAPDGARLHSLHGYFLRPVFAEKQLSYRVTPLREGRTFVMRQLEAVQDGEPVFAMMCSFTADTEGYEYELPIDRDVPAPDELPTSTGPGPWSAAHLGPTPPRPTAHERRRIARGPAFRSRCRTTLTCTRRSSRSSLTSPGPEAGLSTSRATSPAW